MLIASGFDARSVFLECIGCPPVNYHRYGKSHHEFFHFPTGKSHGISATAHLCSPQLVDIYTSQDLPGCRFLRLLKNIESKILLKYGSVSKPCTLVNIKIAGKWMFIPLKMVSIGIDPYPYSDKSLFYLFSGFTTTHLHQRNMKQIARFSGEFDLRPVLVIKC